MTDGDAARRMPAAAAGSPEKPLDLPVSLAAPHLFVVAHVFDSETGAHFREACLNAANGDNGCAANFAVAAHDGCVYLRQHGSAECSAAW